MKNLGVSVVALSEIVGGVLALGGQAIGLWHRALPIPAWFYVAGMSTAAVAIAAGTLLYKGQVWGYGLSLVFQAAQIFQFKASTFVFQIVLGPMVTLDVGESMLGVHAGIFGFTSVWWRAPAAAPELEPPSTMAVNIVAIVALLFLMRQSRRVFAKPAVSLPPV